MPAASSAHPEAEHEAEAAAPAEPSPAPPASSDSSGPVEGAAPVEAAESSGGSGWAPSASWTESGFPSFTFGAATSFVYDINEPDGQYTGENVKTYADGESEESFNIDLVQLGLSGSRGIVSYGTKIDFGDWAAAVEDNWDDDVAIQEMFLAIDATYVVITAGRIPTPIGYEVLEPWANPNISRSRAWFYEPISHDGAALSGQLGPVNLMAAVVNGMHINDTGQNNPDDEYGVIGSLGVPLGDADLRVSAIYSDEEDQLSTVELNAFVAGSWDRWRYGLETTWLDGDGHGSSPRPQDITVWDITGYGGATFGKWSGDLRLSYTDQKGSDGNILNRNHDEIVSFTATGGYEIVDGVVFRVEYRVDSSNNPIFDDHNSGADLAGPFGQSDTINVVNVQLMWTPATGQN